MKFFIVACLLIWLCPAANAFSDTLVWSRQPLQWKDFKGSYDTAVYNRSHLATTYWKLTYFYRKNVAQQQVELLVYPWFDGSRSWVRKNEQNNAQLLQHEQGHFDLAEVLARRFRKRLSEITLPPTGYTDSIQNLFANLLAETYSLQQDYDEATLYGNQNTAQERWHASIDTMLRNLEKFAGKSVFVQLRSAVVRKRTTVPE